MKENSHPKNHSFLRIALFSILFWTAALGGLFCWSVSHEMRLCSELAHNQTRTFFQKFLMTRFWNAMHKGVYVPVSEDSPPNPYLKDDPYRDLETTVGITLTKLNPAYMTRQISHIAAEKSPVRFHLTALDPINPENAPDPWEENAFHQINSQQEYFELTSGKDGEQIYRYLSVLNMEEACLDCHEDYSEKLGTTYGGISVSIPAAPIINSRNITIRTLAISHLIIWLVGFVSIILCSLHMNRNDQKRLAIIKKLEKSRDEVKQLSGMLPICCSCKNIRDDKGYWQRVEQYIGDHADIEFTHGICPDCAKKLYPEFCE